MKQRIIANKKIKKQSVVPCLLLYAPEIIFRDPRAVERHLIP